MTMHRDIPAFEPFASDALLRHLLGQAGLVPGVEGLRGIGDCSGLETPEALAFACALYERVRDRLAAVLDQRARDRAFIDAETRACVERNARAGLDFGDEAYETVIGLRDSGGRVVVGPASDGYFRAEGKPVAALPDWLAAPHVTLFGPPNSARMAVNAMNALHRRLPGEPAIVQELLDRCGSLPKWGADDEDSKTPLRRDLMSASRNLADCFDGSLTVTENGREYRIADSGRSLPIKRIPGLALPCLFLFLRDNPLPMHIYDFALHLFHLWSDPKALVFYVPKLENEEEAAYFRFLVQEAEGMIRALHPGYAPGGVRLLIVLENPRAIFRANEIMDALHPYFAGASLGWHDYLGSAARLFREDGNYRIPVKSDPDIVIKHIKASHELLANVVGPRGGLKIGGMYGVLPTSAELASPSFQVTIKGFVRDVVIQLRRNLDGFWVAHPDFVRVGLALVQAWREWERGEREALRALVDALLGPAYRDEVMAFIQAPDADSLDASDARFPRALLAADLHESSLVANSDPEEVRYNVFQSLQYLTDWLRGNGCVALPARMEGQDVRVMDDLATAERSRWEVWHEIRHGRFGREALADIAFEEFVFIRAGRLPGGRQLQVAWTDATAVWYPVALRLMLLLMTQEEPVEFATELLLPFTLDEIREAADPWARVRELDPRKYHLPAALEARIDALLAGLACNPICDRTAAAS